MALEFSLSKNLHSWIKIESPAQFYPYVWKHASCVHGTPKLHVVWCWTWCLSPVTQCPGQMGWTGLFLNLAPSTHIYHILFSPPPQSRCSFERLELKIRSLWLPSLGLFYIFFCNISKWPLPAAVCACWIPLSCHSSPLPWPPKATPSFLFCPSPQFLSLFLTCTFSDQILGRLRGNESQMDRAQKLPKCKENVGLSGMERSWNFSAIVLGFIATLPQSLPTNLLTLTETPFQ